MAESELACLFRELERLRGIESRLEGLIETKKRGEAEAYRREKLAQTSDDFWMGSAWSNRKEAQRLREERGELEGVLNG